mgnify:FL=1
MKKVVKMDVPPRPERQKLRVAAYARVSTSSDEQRTSLEAQKTYYESYIRANPDWHFAGLYYDEGITGTKKDIREGLMCMLEDCRRGKIDHVMVKSISRLARNTVDTLEIVRELTELGIAIYFEKENINTRSMTGELLLTILSSLAQSESSSISKNEKWSVQKRFEQGTYIIACPPYGYKNEDGKMVIVPEEAEVVRFVFAQYISGCGTYQIGKLLTEKGFSPRRSSRWNDSVINSMLRNEKYVGDVLFQKTYSDEQFNRHINKGDVTQYHVRDHHEPIISREDFAKAQALMKHNGHVCKNAQETGKYRNRYPFSGIVFCGECGRKCKRRTHATKAGKYPVYSCMTHLYDRERCGLLAIDEACLEAAFTTMMNKLIRYHEPVLKPLLDSLHKNGHRANQRRVEKIKQLLEEYSEEQRRLGALYDKGYLDSDTYREKKAHTERMIEDLTAEQARLLEIMGTGTYSLDALERLYRYCQYRKASAEFDAEPVREFLDKVTVHDRGDFTFGLKCGLRLRERSS